MIPDSCIMSTTDIGCSGGWLSGRWLSGGQLSGG